MSFCRKLPCAAHLAVILWCGFVPVTRAAEEPASPAKTDSAPAPPLKTTLEETPPTSTGSAIGPARRTLENFGVDESYFRSLRDGQAVTAEESEALHRFLYHVPRLRTLDLFRWAHRQPWTIARETPADYRGEIFRLSGVVTRVVVEPLSAEAERRLNDREDDPFKEFYRCEVTLAEEETPAIVYARKIPARWKRNESLHEVITTSAVFLKFGEPVAGKSPPIFVAERVAWHPAASPLGRLGVDVGLFDLVKDQTPLGFGDREIFYQLLDAAERSGRDLFDRHVAQAPRDDDQRTINQGRGLFENAAASRGELVTLRGVARRIVPVKVDGDDIVERFGMSEYYEVVMFVEFRDVRVRLPMKSGPDDTSRTYPVVFCARSLPEGLPRGDNINESVRVTGYFLKTYAYRSELSEAGGLEGGQPVPLLVGFEPEWFEQTTGRRNVVYALVAGGVLVAAVLGIVFSLWLSNRRDQAAKAALRDRLASPPDQATIEAALREAELRQTTR